MFYNKSTQIGRGQDNRCNQPRPVGDILTEMFSSNSLFARGYRQHQSVYPNTEPCVDLKLLTREPGRIPLGNYLDGAITRDAEDHFLFIKTPPTRSVMMCSSATRMYTRVSTSTSIASPTERYTLPSTDRSSTNSSHS